jgi:hypothetical protein
MYMFDLSLKSDVEHDPLYMKNHYLHKNIKIINQNLKKPRPILHGGYHATLNGNLCIIVNKMCRIIDFQ